MPDCTQRVLFMVPQPPSTPVTVPLLSVLVWATVVGVAVNVRPEAVPPVGALMVKVTPSELTDVTTAPDGMFVPLIAMPGTRPAVALTPVMPVGARVMVLVPLVLPPASETGLPGMA